MTTTRTSSEHRAALARAVGIGSVMLAGFLVFDLLLRLGLYPDADVAVIVSLRAIGVASAVAAWWIARNPRSSERAVSISHALCLVIVAATVAGLANELGGPNSVYIHGLSIIIMVRSGIVAEPLRQSAVFGGVVVAAYPAVFVVLYAVAPEAHAHWLDRHELSLFVAQFLFVCVSVAAGCLASRASWMAQNQLRQARRLGRYRLEAPIGKGGQGEVWLAHDATLRRKVALKVVRSAHASGKELQLFEREALLASQLENPHAVRIYDFGASDDGVYFLAMEYLDGADLGALVKGHGPMLPARVLHFGIQACRALEEAHAKGLVHRDIKPSNLYAARVGDAYDHLKLLDFGVARSISDDQQLTQTGGVRGTLAYMAPECCRGETATPAADLYGLGAALYHLLAGAPPFTGDDAALVAQQLATPPPPLASRGAVVDPALEAVVLRCLEKDPARRYQDARALREALEACADTARWTQEEAARFWTGERRAALERWEARTVV